MARRTPSQLNMLLAVDKPVGCTSHDVVSQCRRASMSGASVMPERSTPWHRASWWWAWVRPHVCWACLRLIPKATFADISFGVETNTDDAEARPSARCPLPPICAIRPMPASACAPCWARRCRCRRRFRPFRSTACAPISLRARAMPLSCPRVRSRCTPPI